MYKASIGKYNIASEDGFDSVDEAIEYIQLRHPELEREVVEPKVNPLIKGYVNKPQNASKKTFGSGEESTSTYSEGLTKSEARRRK